MTTLREDVLQLFHGFREGGPSGPYSAEDGANRIAALLESTGAPAYCRVATDLRGEWEPDATADVTPT